MTQSGHDPHPAAFNVRYQAWTLLRKSTSTIRRARRQLRSPMIRLGGPRGGLHAECIFEKREPIPDQDDRNANVIEHIDSRYWLQGYSESSCRQSGPKPISEVTLRAPWPFTESASCR
jgi:hypothetical protein